MSDVPCFVGIDVAEAQWDIGVRPSGERWAVPNDADGVVTLVERLQGLHPTLMVLEATGGLERAATATLAMAGLPVVVDTPRQARDFGARPPGSWPRPMRWMRARWRILPTSSVRHPARCPTPRRRHCAPSSGAASH